MSPEGIDPQEAVYGDIYKPKPKLAPVSPNTNIDELLTRDGITELVDYPGGKVIRIKPSVIEEAEALLSAAKISELNYQKNLILSNIVKYKDMGASEMVRLIEERIKELKEQS